MLHVIYYHVTLISFGFHQDTSIINVIGYQIQLPLFFFISGLLACTLKCDLTWLKEKTKKRLLTQFLPSFVTGGLFCLYIGRNIVHNFLYYESKGGYWFTITIFYAFVIFAVISYLTNMLRLSVKQRGLIYAACIIANLLILYAYSNTINFIIPTIVCKLLSMTYLLTFTQYFFLGAIVKLYFDKFKEFLDNRIISSVSLVLFAVLLLQSNGVFLQFLLSTLGIFVTYSIFYHHRNTLCLNTIVGRQLTLIGRNTLQIYFLHFFFIMAIANGIGKSFTDYLAANWYIQLCVVGTISILIAYTCLLFDKILRAVPLIHTLMFGPQNAR